MTLTMARARCARVARLAPANARKVTSTSSLARAVAIAPRSATLDGRAARSVAVKAGEEDDEYMFANQSEAKGALNRDNPDLVEKFAVIGQGDWQCQSCMYEYKPKVGDDFYPVSAGTQFKDLPDDWRCPTCGAEKLKFKSLGKQVAGFEQNQGYGLGTNAMTEGEKSQLIYGALAFFFLCFIAGYLMD